MIGLTNNETATESNNICLVAPLSILIADNALVAPTSSHKAADITAKDDQAFPISTLESASIALAKISTEIDNFIISAPTDWNVVLFHPKPFFVLSTKFLSADPLLMKVIAPTRSTIAPVINPREVTILSASIVDSIFSDTARIPIDTENSNISFDVNPKNFLFDLLAKPCSTSFFMDDARFSRVCMKCMASAAMTGNFLILFARMVNKAMYPPFFIRSSGSPKSSKNTSLIASPIGLIVSLNFSNSFLIISIFSLSQSKSLNSPIVTRISSILSLRNSNLLLTVVISKPVNSANDCNSFLTNADTPAFIDLSISIKPL